MNHPRCPYCLVILGKLPAETVYEDEHVVCFLEVAPINPGHAILVPREHIGGISAVNRDLLSHMMGLTPRLGQIIARSVDADGFNIFAASRGCAGQDVLHAAVHLVPRHGTDGFSFGWRSQPYADAAAAFAVGEAIRFQIARRGLDPLPEYEIDSADSDVDADAGEDAGNTAADDGETDIGG